MQLNLYGVPKQHDFIISPARYKSFFAGRRVGKSYLFTNESVKVSLENAKHRMLYLTHSNPLAREMFELAGYHTALQPIIAERRRKAPYRIIFRNGSYVDFMNWNNISEKIRGLKYHYAWVDEIQSFPEQCFPIVEATTKDTRGRVTVSGQFNGQNYIYHRFYLQGQSPVLLNAEGTPLKGRDGKLIANDLYRSWWMPTSEGLMFQGRLGESELEQTRLVTAPNVWDQEYECLPTANLNAVFGYDELTDCTGGDLGEKSRGARLSYILAVDKGRVVDHSAAVVLEVETGQIVFARLFERGIPYPTQARECAKIAAAFHASTIIDSTGEQGAAGGRTKDPVTTIFRHFIPDVRPFIFTMNSKNHLVTHLGIEIRNRNIQIPAAASELLRQLQRYEYKYRGSGFLTYSAPKGDHDDYVSALMMAVWARHMHWYNSRSNPGHVPTGV